MIKRQRAGEDISELTESESDEDEEEARGAYDTDSDLQALSEFEDEEESPEQERPHRPETKKSRPRTADDDHYDSEFVVEDDAPLGVPDIGIPSPETL